MSGQDAPSASVAETRPALKQGRLGPRSDHRGKPLGPQVENLVHHRFEHAARQMGPPRTIYLPRSCITSRYLLCQTVASVLGQSVEG